MCGLCQISFPHVFVHPLVDPADRAKVEAKQLKEAIARHEKEDTRRQGLGLPQCKKNTERLQAMKAQQYELAKEL